MRIGPIGLNGVGAAYFRFGTGAMRRARAAVSVGPLSEPAPVEPAAATGREPNTLYDPNAQLAELHRARPKRGRRLDIRV